jgi:hypothetical protein
MDVYVLFVFSRIVNIILILAEIHKKGKGTHFG